MLLGVALAALSALLGGALALLAQRRRSLLELTRTFAFAAAGGVVAFHLLPELLPAMGAAALLWIALGFALPWLLEVAARSFGPRLLRGQGLTSARVAAEVGFAALVFHSVAEGLALVAALEAPTGRVDLEVALVAHHAPLTAAVTLPVLALLGTRAALVRVLGIAAAGVSGVLLSALVPGLRTDTALLQVATAVTAGALLHVVADEIREQRFASRGERAADMLACLLGLGVAGFGALLHPPAIAGFARPLLALSLAAAPGLVAGLVARRWTRVPLDAVLIALLLLGPVPAAALLGLLLLAPRAGAGAAARLEDAAPRPERRIEGGSRGSGRGAVEERADDSLVRRFALSPLQRRAPWLLAALVAAAALDALAPARLPREPWAVALLLLVPLVARVDVAGATLLAAVLAGKGVPPGLTIALVAGGVLLHLGPLRVARVSVAGTAVACVGLATLGERAGFPSATRSLAGASLPLTTQLAAHPAQALLALLLLTLLALTVWDTGVRGWFAPLRHRQ
jgi:hypothetical protein